MKTVVIRWFATAALCVQGALPLSAQTYRAQSISVTAGILKFDETAVKNPLYGGRAIFHYSFLRDILSFRIGGGAYWAHADRSGSYCEGPFRPSCPPIETFKDSVHAFLFNAGFGVKVFDQHRTRVAIFGDFGRGELRATSFGQMSNGRYDIRKLENTISFGVETSWLPSKRIPIGVELEASMGSARPTTEDFATDTSQPWFFNDPLKVSRISIGVIWQPFKR